PRIAIHAMVMPDGRLMTYGTTPDDGQGAFDYDLWDPKRGTGDGAHLTLPSLIAMNSFCAAQVLQPWNGVVLTAGGNSATGAGNYDARTLKTNLVNATRYPRWYGTLTTMPDGRLTMQGGMVPYDWYTHSITPEVFTPGQGWSELPGARSADAYGSVFEDGRANYVQSWPVSNTRLFTIAGQATFYLDIAGQGSISGLQPFARPNWGATSTAVMYQPGKILKVGGGGSSDLDRRFAASRAATLLDITGPAPVITETAPMTFPRHWGTATLMANGEVLVIGGSAVSNADLGTVYAAEIWNPATQAWRIDASAAVMRLYHSTAILLPDGRVFTGGGGAPGPISARNAEIYTPAYLLDAAGNPAPRPAITAAPGLLTLGQSFPVTATSASGIARVTLLKTGAVTHGWNNDQRFIELGFRASGNTLSVDAPANTVIATPGYYMLFVIDRNGVPSEARMVKVPVPSSLDERVAPGDAPSANWTATVGTSRGGLWNIACADGEVVAGLYGTADAAIGGVGPRCVTAVTGRWTANPRSVGAGLDARPPFLRDCPRDQAITAIGGQASVQATQLVVTCSPMNAANGSAGGGGKLAAVGNGGGTAVPDAACGESGSAYGLYGEGNAQGSRVGLLCRNGTRAGGATASPAPTTSAPTASAPTLPAPTTPAPTTPAPSATTVLAALPTSPISLESASNPGYYVRPLGTDALAAAQAASVADKSAASFTVRPGLAGSGVSLQSVAAPRKYLRHQNFVAYTHDVTDSPGAYPDATFRRGTALAAACGCTSGACLSYEAVNYPGFFLRARAGQMVLEARQEADAWKLDASFCERPALGSDVGTGSGAVSLQSSNLPGSYVTNIGGAVALVAPGNDGDRQRATFRQVAGLAGQGISFEALASPGQYLRHAYFQMWQTPPDGGQTFTQDASLLPVSPLGGSCGCSGQCVSYESVNYRGYYLRHAGNALGIQKPDGSASFRQDASFCAAAPLATAATGAQAGSWRDCAPEGGTCTVSGQQSVRYGANGQYVTRSVTGPVGCNNAIFGDPVPGTVKTCQVMAAATQ
ncbi:AbfB domain-containing protein, partial [Methylobacterium soli]